MKNFSKINRALAAKKKLFSIFFISFCWICCVNATTLHVENLQGNDFAMAVKQIGKLIINGTTLQFYDRQGDLLYTSDMSTVSVMTFDEEAESSDPNDLNPSDPPEPSNPTNPTNPEEPSDQAIDNVQDGKTPYYTAYPNPTNTMVIINGLAGETTLRLYSLEGQLIKKSVGTTMNMEDVPNGDYLLQCESQIIKIIKQ